MRVHPFVSEILRVPKKDIVLPLAAPIVGISGKVYKELAVPAGTVMAVSLAGYNLYVCLPNSPPLYKSQGLILVP